MANDQLHLIEQQLCTYALGTIAVISFKGSECGFVVCVIGADYTVIIEYIY